MVWDAQCDLAIALAEAYRRGVHLSLGAKHGSYNKPNIKRTTAKHHVDVFAITESFILDDEVIYRDGAWQVD